jgi:tetratricopeptide (TPR) repeat protein
MSGTPKRPSSQAAALLRQALSHLDRNAAAQAEASLLRASELTPDDADVLQLMGVLRRFQGRPAEAEKFFRLAIARDPLGPQAHHNLGNLLAADRHFGAAAAEQREAIRLKPNFAEAHLSLALALSATGDHDSAMISCQNALRIQPNFILAKQCLAAELSALNRPKDAERILRQVLSLGVPDPRAAAGIEHNIGVSLNMQNRTEEALSFFDKASARVPGMPGVDFSRGDTLQRLGRLEDAFEAFCRATEVEPKRADAPAFAALVAARMSDFESARIYGQRALALDSGQGIALIALAISDIENGDYALATERLRLVLDRPATHHNSQPIFAAGFAADALDGRGQAAMAFAVYSESNAKRRESCVAALESIRAIDDVARLNACFSGTRRWNPSPTLRHSDSGAVGHVFVVGFMRSGTSLLTAALAGHSQVVAIDERELLAAPAAAYLLSGAGLERLKTLDSSAIDGWRNAYWEGVRAAGLQVAHKVFVEKMPFNSLRLPLISRLFPEAKVVFAVRDPRDVVLSCFRRRFDLNPFTFEFLRLEDCARFYASTMTLCVRYREALPLNIMSVYYEKVVSEYQSSLSAVCGFVGIDWQDSLLDLSAALDVIDRRSASILQVRRGLYGEGAGQWRRYSEQLAPVTPMLHPWIEHFGYPAQ